MEAGGCWGGSAVSVGLLGIETTVSSVLNSEVGASIFQVDSRCYISTHRSLISLNRSIDQ
jgi:hypothetical protein